MRMKILYAGLLTAGLLGSASVMGDTTTVSVGATVVGACQFNSGGSVDFGNLDPAVGGNATGTVTQPEFWCTKNASWSISDDDGLNESGAIQRMKHATLTEYIPYSFSYTASGSGNGPTSPITMDISASVVEADYLNASAGDYSDTVTLTITP
jgi:spore coat protein U-like protein